MSWSALLALLAPPACLACRAPLAVASALVCAPCMRELRWLGPDVCHRCALPSHLGRRCPAERAPFRTAWAPLAHQGPARALVRALKFDGALPAAGLMAAQMAANVPPWALGAAADRSRRARPPNVATAAQGDDTPPGTPAPRPPSMPAVPRLARHAVARETADAALVDRRGAADVAIVAVPPARGRTRRRGFDPAGLLAAELARRLELPVAGCLRRTGRPARQLGARRAQRRAPGRIAVELTAPPPRRVLLVDDVHTTGATLNACGQALVRGGALDVCALSYVRAL